MRHRVVEEWHGGDYPKGVEERTQHHTPTDVAIPAVTTLVFHDSPGLAVFGGGRVRDDMTNITDSPRWKGKLI